MTLDQILVLVLLVGVFIAFIREWVPPDMVALSTTAILLATGILTTNETLEVFSNPGVLTVGAMFVLSAALDRTGCIEALGNASLKLVGRSRRVALLGLILLAASVSAIINNTPVVVILTPVVIRLCQHLKIAPSKMLIPLSYAAVFGGTCTLVGTSTNLLVDSVAQRLGQPAFGLLEIAPLGLIMTGVGAAYLLVFGDRILPERNTVSDVLSGQPKRQFLTEIMVPLDSPAIGKSLDEVKLGAGAGSRVVDVLRGDESLRRNLPAVRLEAGDRVLLKTAVQGVMDLREQTDVAFEGGSRLQQVATHRTAIVEGIVGPRSSFVEHKLSHFNLRRRYGVYIIALHRQGVNLRDKFEDVRIEVGDTVLLEGPQDGIRRLVDSGDLINLTAPEHHPLRRNKAWIAILALLAVVGLSALNVMPIAGLAIIAAVVV